MLDIRHVVTVKLQCKSQCDCNNSVYIGEKSMKKVFSWIFAILSLILLVVFVVFLILYIKATKSGVKNFYMPIFMNAIMSSILIGAFGHFMAKKKSFPYYATFITCGVIYIFVFIAGAFKFLFNRTLDHAGDFPSPKKDDKPVYIVNENGYERRLTLFEAYNTDYEAPLNAGYGRTYSRFRDENGDFWRSYDGNKTFIRE